MGPGWRRGRGGGDAGPGHWGPQSPPVLCQDESQFWCDDGPFGKGTGGQLRYQVTDPGRTRQLTAPFAALFNPVIVTAVLPTRPYPSVSTCL